MVWIRTLFWGWIAVAVRADLRRHRRSAFASGLARASLVAIAGVGTGLIVYFALRGQDRALSLIPSWMLLVVWLFGAAMIVLGKLSGDLVVSGLVAGLVLILVLLGFTVTQFAFRSGGASLEPRAAEPRADEVARRGRLRRPCLPVVCRQGPDHRGERGGAGAWARAWRAQRRGRGLPPAYAQFRPRALPAHAVVATGEAGRRPADRFPPAAPRRHLSLVRPPRPRRAERERAAPSLHRLDARRDQSQALP